MAQQQLSTNTFGVSQWIVSNDATQGTHTTIGAALSAASSGQDIFIRPKTDASAYTEDLTLKDGVNLIAWPSDSEADNNVTIVGKMSASFSGNCSITGIRLQTNSDYFLSLTGANATGVSLYKCSLRCSNNTGINSSGSNSSASVRVVDCNGSLETTGIAYYNITNGTLSVFYTTHNNSGLSTTANTLSGSQANLRYSYFGNGFTTSGSAQQLDINHCHFALSATNATAITHNSTSSANNIYDSTFETGSGASISIGSGANLRCVGLGINSTNSNPVTGAGTIVTSPIFFSNTGVGINVTSTTFKTISVAMGGTGNGTLTNHGVLVGAGTSAITQLAAGTSGQVLQSGGGSADPAYSTATYPATATSTGQVLTADGTNWVSSAAPAPSASSAIITVKTSLTNSQIKNLHATPIQVVAAPGANKIIVIVYYAVKYTYGGNNAFTAAASQSVDLEWGTNQKVITVVSNGNLIGTTTTKTLAPTTSTSHSGATTNENLALNLYNPVATEISGNAANDNLINVTVAYYIADVS